MSIESDMFSFLQNNRWNVKFFKWKSFLQTQRAQKYLLYILYISFPFVKRYIVKIMVYIWAEIPIFKVEYKSFSIMLRFIYKIYRRRIMEDYYEEKVERIQDERLLIMSEWKT